MEYGHRLLPQVVDHHAQVNPDRVYASIPKSTTELADGFEDISMARLASIVNRLAWWLEETIGRGDLEAIAYIGPADIRYAAMFLAAVKCSYKMLFISPRNQLAQNSRMLQRSNCKALFFAGELSAVADALKSAHGDILYQTVATLAEILKTPATTQHYPYDKSFKEAEKEPCLILHSSGSTGDPKLVTMTHGTFACTDNDRNMPVPDGRKAQNAAQFNFEGGGRFYSCFPPYHLAGVHAYIDLPIFSTTATCVFGPTNLPPSGYLVSEILKYQPDIRAFYVPPFIIEQWSAEPPAAEQANRLDFVLYGGGPLNTQIGERLSQVTNVCQMYGSLEIGQVQLLVPQPGEWSYMELNPYEEADMQPFGDGSYEMVLHQHPKFAKRRSLYHNLPNSKEWHTGDLFVPHPTKKGLWRYQSRVDDLIILSSSHKLRPVEMETAIQGDALLSGALIVGQGRPEPLLIVEPKPDAFDGVDAEAFIDRIWPTVQEANKLGASYAKIDRSRIIVADAERPFIRAPKGSVVRKLTTKLYSNEIEAAYEDVPNTSQGASGSTDGLQNFMLPGLKMFVRQSVERLLPGIPIADSDNLFLKGLDSLTSASLTRSLQKNVAATFPNGGDTAVTLRLVYTHPSIDKLSSLLLKIMTRAELEEPNTGNDIDLMKRAVEELTEGLPVGDPETASNGQTKTSLQVDAEAADDFAVKPHTNGTKFPEGFTSAPSKVNVALLGPRGALGPNVLDSLFADPRVGKIYCLNRGEDGRAQMKAIVKTRGLPIDVEDPRLAFMPTDIMKHRLGLSQLDYAELQSNAHVIIHNAWKVDFRWTLESYMEAHMGSIRELIDLSLGSSTKMRVTFVSSIASAAEWNTVYPDTAIEEKPFDSYEVASPLGYGQSKHVSERVLAAASCSIPVTILRMGQIASPTRPNGGMWPAHEWVPSLVTLSKALKSVPTDLPSIDWIPADYAGEIVSQLTVADVTSEDHSLAVYNVVNPQSSPWSTFASVLQDCIGEGTEMVSLLAWTRRIAQAADRQHLSAKEAQLATKILPWFDGLCAAAKSGKGSYAKSDTQRAQSHSVRMRQMKPVDEGLVKLWMDQWAI